MIKGNSAPSDLQIGLDGDESLSMSRTPSFVILARGIESRDRRLDN